MGNGHALVADTTDEQTATMHGEPGVTVRHEDLRICEDGNLHIAPEVFAIDGPPVTNLMAEYI
jgi:hypothetical protein